MSDGRERLAAVTEQLLEYGVVTDAFLAKSFTDRLLIVDVTESAQLPADALELIHEHDFRALDSLNTDDKRPPLLWATSVGRPDTTSSTCRREAHTSPTW